ncbi:MAG TPA: DUF1697 domain-containing protein [Microthrixaceae bacterium]|nr:DUF1697 domain-containing protein [Microthrixaceae bacterium]
MTTWVALLGGINVGGHRVSMEQLRSMVDELDVADVWTFIASGNVIFDAPGRAATWERSIEAHLGDRLGYAVPTFVRSSAALAKAVAQRPFGEVPAGHTHMVMFLRRNPTAAERRAIEALSTELERLEVHDNEVHWLIDGGVSDSTIWQKGLAKAIGQPLTTRNTKSLTKLVAKLGEITIDP